MVISVASFSGPAVLTIPPSKTITTMLSFGTTLTLPSVTTTSTVAKENLFTVLAGAEEIEEEQQQGTVTVLATVGKTMELQAVVKATGTSLIEAASAVDLTPIEATPTPATEAGAVALGGAVAGSRSGSDVGGGAGQAGPAVQQEEGEEGDGPDDSDDGQFYDVTRPAEAEEVKPEVTQGPEASPSSASIVEPGPKEDDEIDAGADAGPATSETWVTVTSTTFNTNWVTSTRSA